MYPEIQVLTQVSLQSNTTWLNKEGREGEREGGWKEGSVPRNTGPHSGQPAIKHHMA